MRCAEGAQLTFFSCAKATRNDSRLTSAVETKLETQVPDTHCDKSCDNSKVIQTKTMVALPTQTLWLLVFLRASADGVELFDRVGLGKPFSREHTTLAFNREPRTSFYTRLSEGFTEVDAPASPVSSPVYSPGASPVYSPVASPVAPVSPKGRTSKGQSSEPKTAKTSTAKTTTAKTTTAKTTTAKTTRTTKDAKGTRTTEKTSKGKEEKCKKDKGSKGGGTGEDGCEEDGKSLFHSKLTILA